MRKGQLQKLTLKKRKGFVARKLKKRTDRPFNLDWKNSKVKALGIWIGNEDTPNENFIEQQAKIKNKLIFWKRRRLSLLERIKVLNILSRLWYRTEF